MTSTSRLIAGLALASCASTAQSPKLVKLDVTALDGKSRPVSDLRPGEVQIRDDGRHQQMVFFSERQDRPLKDGTQLGPQEFSNRASAAPHVTVVLLNSLDPAVQKPQWDETVRAIHGFETSDDVYLYVLGGSGVLLPIRALPGSEEEATRQGPWTSRLIPQFEGAPGLYHEPIRGTGPGERDDPTVRRATAYTAAYGAVEEVASRMSRLSGRKSLVWIGSLPLLTRRQDFGESPAGRAMADKMLRLLTMLDMADIAVYEVQPTVPHAVSSGNIDNSPPAPLMVPGSATDDRPGLAAATGGCKYVDEIGKAIAQAVVDTHQGYRVIYMPQPEESRRKYHKISVACTRRGVHLRTRDGYDSEAVEEPEARRREFVDLLVESLRDAPGIGLRVTLSRRAESPQSLHIQLHVDAADVLLLPQGGAFRGKLALQFVRYTEDGRKQVGGDPIDVAINLAGKDRATALTAGILVPLDVPVDASTQKVRVIVCDDLAQFAGSVTVPILNGRGPAE